MAIRSKEVRLVEAFQAEFAGMSKHGTAVSLDMLAQADARLCLPEEFLQLLIGDPSGAPGDVLSVDGQEIKRHKRMRNDR